MNDRDQIPSPDSSGSSGTQVAAPTTDGAEVEYPLPGLPVVSALDGLVTSHARSLGGLAPATLLNAYVLQLGQENVQLKDEQRRLRGRLDDSRDALGIAKTRVAVLEDRLRSEAKNKNVRNLCITVGVALLSLGYSLYTREGPNGGSAAVIAAIVGALLFGVGWLSSPKPEEKKND